MNQVTVIVRTAEKDNLSQGGNECKFYRTYDLDKFWVVQYGSMRNGKSGGQFKVTDAGHASRATSAADQQFSKKLNDGYGGSSVDQFTVDLDRFTAQGSGGGQWLENMYDAARSSGQLGAGSAQPAAPPRTPKPKATPAVDPSNASAPNTAETSLAGITARALAAISLAATEPAKALTEHSLLTAQLEEVDLQFRKARSYLSTLDTLIEEAL